MPSLLRARKFVDSIPFEAPIPGQSYTQAKGANPMELPPRFADPRQGLEHIFNNLITPQGVKRVLGLLEAGIPLDTMVVTIVKYAMGEGLISPMGAVNSVPSITVMLMRMAEAANVNWTTTQDLKPKKALDEDQLLISHLRYMSDDKKAGKAMKEGSISSPDLTELPADTEGIMKPPEELF